MIDEMIMYDWDDLSMIPAHKTKIRHRADCVVNNSDGMLPLFASPMSSVISIDNYKKFLSNGINVVIPRTEPLDKRLSLINDVFVAFGLEEFERTFVNSKTRIADMDKQMYVCIDIAFGHMEYLSNVIMIAKDYYKKNLVIMAGNVTSPEAYERLGYAGVNYVRVGIGGGSVCTTSVLSGVHVTIPSILPRLYDSKRSLELQKKEQNNNPDEAIGNYQDIIMDGMRIRIPDEVAYMYKQEKDANSSSIDGARNLEVPKIIVDGGFNSYAKINKALAMGADYVMLGGMLAMTEEACGDIVDNNEGRFHVYYGMSTERAQIEYNGKATRKEEGITKLVPIKYSVKTFVDEFKFYLREAMSMTNSSNLDEFSPNNIMFRIISNSAFNAFNTNKM